MLFIDTAMSLAKEQYLSITVKGEAAEYLREQARKLDRKPVWVAERAILAEKKKEEKKKVA